jgi:hypothetical protein
MTINERQNDRYRYNYQNYPMGGPTLPQVNQVTYPSDIRPVVPGVQPTAILPSVIPEPTTMEILPSVSQIPTTMESPFYLAGLLKNYIGEYMRVQYLIGTNAPLIDRTGTLREVGANYIIMQPENSDDLVISDLYSIKFIDIVR